MMDRIGKLEELLADNPTDNFIQHALALEFIKQGDDEKACGLFEQLLKRDASYIGSYYHLAKLHERQGRQEEAVSWYQRGMIKAKEAGDRHAYNELQSGYEDLVY